jgi:hypothetical protein
MSSVKRAKFLVTACLILIAAAVSASPALADAKRVALVIGNNDYENVPKLQKAVNDADAVAAELSKLGFDVVKAENVGQKAMSRAVNELETKIGSGDTVLFYFAGHGFAVDGTNYLLPVDVPEAGPGEEGIVRDASFAATGLSDRLQQKGAGTVIFTHGPDRRHVRAVLGRARTIGARSFERDRLQSEFGVHAHAAHRDGGARPIHGADREEDAEQSARACRQGRPCAGASLLRSNRRRSLSRAGRCRERRGGNYRLA